MPKQKQKSERIPFDNYPTDPRLVKAIVERLRELYGNISHTHVLIEPSAGSGNFVREMRQAWPLATLLAVELRLEEEANLRAAGATHTIIADFAQWIVQYAPQALALMIGNPPFTYAQLHLERAFQMLAHGSEIAFLLRFSFFGGRERNRTFWMSNGGRYLKHIIPIAPRPTFKKGVSDNSEYAVYIWKIGHTDPATILPPILWKEDVSPSE